MWREEDVLVCQVGPTTLTYQWRAVEDLHTWLKGQGDWVPLGAVDESKPAAEGTVEAWGRSEGNPVGGWYGLRKGYRGRFGMYLPPLLEALGLAEVTHDAGPQQGGASARRGRRAPRRSPCGCAATELAARISTLDVALLALPTPCAGMREQAGYTRSSQRLRLLPVTTSGSMRPSGVRV
jgi:hypothetical protein